LRKAAFPAAGAGGLEVNRYLLDTNVVSELRKPKPHGAVVAWLGNLQENQIFLSAATIGELQAGIERVRHQDTHKAAEIESWLDHVAESHQVLPMDTSTFREWARLMDGKSDDLLEDGMIAATARVHQLIVATRNERDFANWRTPIVNPFRTAT
jgi:predicted nucleic acid-binding protein